MRFLKNKNPDIRRMSDLREVLFDKEWAEKAEDFDAYYMYRGVDERDNLRYDITVIPFNMFGSEFPKTKGHYHPQGYGEIYTVLKGKAIYLIQTVSDVYAIYANKGDVAVIPPGSGHITINPGEGELVMANWVSPEFSSDYGPIIEKEGGCYFYTKEGWVRNENYENSPELRFEDPRREIPDDVGFLYNT